MNWLSFGIAFVLCVVIPVWFLKFADISIFMQIAYTVAGAVGVYIALEFGSMRKRR